MDPMTWTVTLDILSALFRILFSIYLVEFEHNLLIMYNRQKKCLNPNFKYDFYSVFYKLQFLLFNLLLSSKIESHF